MRASVRRETERRLEKLAQKIANHQQEPISNTLIAPASDTMLVGKLVSLVGDHHYTNDGVLLVTGMIMSVISVSVRGNGSITLTAAIATVGVKRVSWVSEWDATRALSVLL